MSKKLLSLSTLDPERPIIEIDEARYECAVHEDFGAVQLTRLQRLMGKVSGLKDDDDASDEQAEEAARTVEDACRKALAIILPGLPIATLDKLRLSQMINIMTAYQGFIQAARTGASPEALPNPTGASLPQDSSDSTAATLQDG